MNSISELCQEKKERYDSCFLKWFSDDFLKYHDRGRRNKGKMKEEQPCEKLLEDYKKCVNSIIKEKKINLWEVEDFGVNRNGK
ncbi:hypothetical protein SNEBB_004172 [Seison nebaliae]|nr:hypothetical protein SNEBB_004172 [Seison nebaliae]